MTVHQHNALTAFLATICNRLWLQSIARLLYRGLWVSTLVLMTCGALHFFAFPLSLRLCVAIALIPPLVALGTGVLFRRPSRQAAAHAADRWFEGKALFTSAWELQAAETLPATPSAALVLQRAQTSAAQLQQRVSSEHPVAWPHSAGLPFALAFIGIFVLLLPGARTSDEPTPADGLATLAEVSSGLRPDPMQTADNSTAQAALGPVQTPRQPTADSGEHSAAKSARQTTLQGTTPRGDSQLAFPNRAEQAVRDRVDVTSAPVQVAEPQRAGIGALANAETGAGTGDTTAGGERAHRPSQDRDTASPDMAFQAIEMARGGNDPSGAVGDAVVELSTSATPPIDSAPPDINADMANRVSLPYRPEFPPALRLYVSRYFHQLGSKP